LGGGGTNIRAAVRKRGNRRGRVEGKKARISAGKYPKFKGKNRQSEPILVNSERRGGGHRAQKTP